MLFSFTSMPMLMRLKMCHGLHVCAASGYTSTASKDTRGYNVENIDIGSNLSFCLFLFLKKIKLIKFNVTFISCRLLEDNFSSELGLALHAHHLHCAWFIYLCIY